MSYADAIAAERRLAILQALAEAHPAPLAERVLARVVEEFGVPIGHAALDGDLAYLEAAGCLRRAERTARITPLGLDVAQGRVRIQGVARTGDW